MSVEFGRRRKSAPPATCCSCSPELILPLQRSDGGNAASVSWSAGGITPRPVRVRRARAAPAASFELATVDAIEGRPQAGKLLVSRPLAALAVLPRPLVLFAAGAVSGAIGAQRNAHTLTAQSAVPCRCSGLLGCCARDRLRAQCSL